MQITALFAREGTGRAGRVSVVLLYLLINLNIYAFRAKRLVNSLLKPIDNLLNKVAMLSSDALLSLSTLFFSFRNSVPFLPVLIFDERIV